ncbi:MAG: malonyl-ACP O-methyltransferase BioC [Gammaproteobacteria bacterium]|nr:malonyl-ACP O-methyltransferase BioC [Gammaproteobacteria bacterium]NIR82198.1 malonyl-ACP O-methyltransferase BioC [Gammaproteobacteria bacterium]NIR90797.1 malonyl-ACP O-methyltransferase BioC [Gammaproteobacteria bacterium]NIU03348.1 malonyl-ACP O-methyltransferase BioC [Gammaproteobacteria bacterium]NIV50844.1 malonyl-ACP O-methyltransferase BioC [Gammaproteobacteria bacterium]
MGSDNATAAELNKRQVRQAFARAARDYDRHARVQQEVGMRLLEHLDPIKLQPARILDAGAGTGTLARELATRYGRALVVALDIAEPMLQAARVKAPRFFSRQRFVCADSERLPLQRDRFDLVFSNLLLQWFTDPEPVFREFVSVLAPGRPVLFSSLGPDTLRELRESWAAADALVHVHAFLDMHDVGDALVRTGFVDVVMETERLTVQYPSVDILMRDLRGLGARNASAGRRRALTAPARLDRMREAYERLRTDAGLPATFEVVYGHAWKPEHSAFEVSIDALRQRP